MKTSQSPYHNVLSKEVGGGDISRDSINLTPINSSHKKKKICISCGNEFISSIYNKKLCSDECRIKRRRQWFRKYAKKYRTGHPSYLEYQKNYFKENRENIEKNKKRWYKTKKGRRCRRIERSIQTCKSKNKKWIPILPNIFPDNISVDYHHIDGKWFVVALPKTIHNAFGKTLDKHLEHNKEWIEFYYNFNATEFLSDIPTEIQK